MDNVILYFFGILLGLLAGCSDSDFSSSEGKLLGNQSNEPVSGSEDGAFGTGNDTGKGFGDGTLPDLSTVEIENTFIRKCQKSTSKKMTLNFPNTEGCPYRTADNSPPRSGNNQRARVAQKESFSIPDGSLICSFSWFTPEAFYTMIA